MHLSFRVDITGACKASDALSNALHGLQQITRLHSAYLKFKEDAACMHSLCEDRGDKTRRR